MGKVRELEPEPPKSDKQRRTEGKTSPQLAIHVSFYQIVTDFFNDTKEVWKVGLSSVSWLMFLLCTVEDTIEKSEFSHRSILWKSTTSQERKRQTDQERNGTKIGSFRNFNQESLLQFLVTCSGMERRHAEPVEFTEMLVSPWVLSSFFPLFRDCWGRRLTQKIFAAR